MKAGLQMLMRKPACLLIAAVLLVTLGPASVAAEEGASEGIITVSGSASLEVGADLANLSFGVDSEAPTAAEALQANSSAMEKVVAAVREAGIDPSDLSTAQFNISPVYERQQERMGAPVKQLLRGYRVNNLLHVNTASLDKVATVVDAAVMAGANRVDRISFGLSPDLNQRSRRQLIEAAVEDARYKAMLALAPLDMQIVGVKNLSIAERAQPGPRFAEGMRMDMAVSAAPPVFAGDQGVSVTVNVTFLIGPQ